MNEEILYYVGFCSCCGTGPLGIRICGGCQRPWIVCDECDAVWATPDCDGQPMTPSDLQLPCPTCQTSLRKLPSRWAKAEDLARIGWESDVVGKGSPLATDPVETETDSDDDCGEKNETTDLSDHNGES
ncbi:MAG: hypothetical protein GY768_09375 [Planctomycetaceae bacterium]|nr:hypothetical protein [Planctomycetaceae bacterium]